MNVAAALSSIVVDNFRGDFEGLSDDMIATWSENRQQPLLYTPEYLRSMLQQPGASLDFAPALYDRTQLVAFAAGFVRTVSWRGRTNRLLLGSFATVSRQYRGHRLGRRAWHELAVRGEQFGLSGLLGYCVEGDRMDAILPAYSRSCGMDTECIFQVTYVA
ncbi:MAG TPA: hypothetical protein VGC88_01105, partial [Terriglobales bacterium]